MQLSFIARTITAACLMLSSHALLADDVKPGVTIYATGGTIAGKAESNTATTGYQAGAIGIQELLNAVPAIGDVATVTGEQIANTASGNIDQAILLKLSKAINKQLSDANTHGVVVTHGTDTLEETAFFLDLTVKSEKPVVIVGAMRPATAISADGSMNLLEAVTLATSKNAEKRGAMVLLNDRIGSAFYTTKTNATSLDTFKANEQGYLGAFYGGVPRFFYQPAAPENKPFFDVSNKETLAKVDILYGYQDQDSGLLNAAIEQGAKGIIIAGSGNGSTPTRIKEDIKKAVAKGIPVVISTRTGNGYVTDKKKDGAIGSGFYNPQKARILLSLALSNGDDIEKIRSYFEQ
ncbi:asparaginase [Pectobacterium aroidearum]|uniref:asparaginase n=1 Tax=Pectobacterium aroidearum TaxID=1201031 RepID=UPI0032EC277C